MCRGSGVRVRFPASARMSQPESRLQRRIRGALEVAFPRSYWWKTHGGPFTPSGIPDLIGSVYGRMCALEIKRDDGEASAVQLRIIDRLRRAGAISGVVRSTDEALSVVRDGLFPKMDDPRLPGKVWSRIREGELPLIHNRKCWLWTDKQGRILRTRAKTINLSGQRFKVTRFIFESTVGVVSPSLELDHLCKVLPCVNPAHLEPVSHQENTRRSGYKFRGTPF